MTLDENFEVQSKVTRLFFTNIKILEFSWIENHDYFFILLADSNTMDFLYLRVIDKQSGTDLKLYNQSGVGINSDISPLKNSNLLVWAYSNVIQIINASDKNSITRNIKSLLTFNIQKIECHHGEPNDTYPHMFAIYNSVSHGIMFGIFTDIVSTPFSLA